METRPGPNGLARIVPTTPLEIEMTRRVLEAMTAGKLPSGVHLQLGDYEEDGWYQLTAIAGPMSLDIPRTLGGKISLLEREYPASEYYRLDVAWQYDGQGEYWGGDGPLSNAAVLFQEVA